MGVQDLRGMKRVALGCSLTFNRVSSALGQTRFSGTPCWDPRPRALPLYHVVTAAGWNHTCHSENKTLAGRGPASLCR